MQEEVPLGLPLQVVQHKQPVRLPSLQKPLLISIGVPDPDPGAKSSSDPADFGAVMRSADPF